MWKVNWHRGSPGPINIIQDFVDLVNESDKVGSIVLSLELGGTQLLEGLAGVPIVPPLRRVPFEQTLPRIYIDFVRETIGSSLFSTTFAIQRKFSHPLFFRSTKYNFHG